VILALHDIVVQRDGWSVRADARFAEGIHLVTGRVGSGKSTLAHLLAGSVVPETGRTVSEGITSVQIGLQFPEHQVTAATVAGEIRSWGLDPQVIMPETALTDKSGVNPLLLSGGELRRLELACVLRKDPDLLLLDEPFSSLDCREKNALCLRIENRNRGITIIFSHETWHLPRIDNLWEIVNGTLENRGTIPDALTRWTGAPPLLRRLIISRMDAGDGEVTRSGCRMLDSVFSQQ